MREIYLSNMGIQIWQERFTLPGAKQVILVNHAALFKFHEIVGDLIITPSLESTILSSMAEISEEKVHKLLVAMLSAIKLQPGKMHFISDLENYDIANYRPMLVLGDINKNIKILQNRPTVLSFHPAHLLVNPQDKAIAWQHLKTFSLFFN